MVDVSIVDSTVVFEVEGLDRLWSLRSRLEVPLAHVRSVDTDTSTVGRWWHGLRLLGTHVPGLLTAGTFYQHGELVFWDVHNPANTVIVELDHERYKKLVIEVAKPDAVIDLITTALRSRHQS